MNNRKIELDRITKEQIAVIEKAMKANKVEIDLYFNFSPTKKTRDFLNKKGYLVKLHPQGFRLIIDTFNPRIDEEFNGIEERIK